MKKFIVAAMLITPIVLYCMQPSVQQGAQPSSMRIQPAIHPGTFGKLYNKNVYGALVALKKKLRAEMPELVILEILGKYLQDTSIDRTERINVALEFIADPQYALYQKSLIDLLYSIPNLAFPIGPSQVSPLRLAENLGYSAQVRAALSPEDSETQSKFFVLLINNRLDLARQMLKNKDINIHRKNRHGMTLLSSAVHNDASSARIIKNIKLLLEYGADINGSGNDRQNPLLLTRSPEVVQFLLEQGANPNIKVMYSGQLIPLIHLIYYDPAIIRLLTHAGVDINARDDQGRTPLLRVIDNENIDGFNLDKQRTIEALINVGANVDAKNNSGMTAMYNVAFRHDIPMIELLRRNGASINILNDSGQSPLSYVMWKHDRDNILPTVQALIAQGADVNFYDKSMSFQAPLARAVENDLPNVVTFLLQGGASLEGLWMIKNIKNPEMVQALIAGGFDINALDTNGETKLTDLTRTYGTNILELINILAFRPDVNKPNKFGDTPLSLAVDQFSHVSPSNDDTLAITQALIDAGADVNKGGQKERTPLMNVIKAAGTRHPELAIPVVQLLLSKGADPLKRDRDGINAILGAVLFNQGNILELLTKDAAILRAFAQKDVPTLAARLIDANVNKNELLALIAMYATPKQQSYLNTWAQYLLDHGANPNTIATVSGCSDKVESVLESALVENNIKLAEILIAKGANINIQNQDGNTILMEMLAESADMLLSPTDSASGMPSPRESQSSQSDGRDYDMYLGRTPRESQSSQSDDEEYHSTSSNLRSSSYQNCRSDNEECSSDNESDSECPCCRGSHNTAALIEFLIKHGADLTIKNKNGETALDLARKNGHTKAAQQIEQALAAQKSQPESVSGSQPSE